MLLMNLIRKKTPPCQDTEWSKKTAQSWLHHHFATICRRITRFSPKCAEINW